MIDTYLNQAEQNMQETLNTLQSIESDTVAYGKDVSSIQQLVANTVRVQQSLKEALLPAYSYVLNSPTLKGKNLARSMQLSDQLREVRVKMDKIEKTHLFHNQDQYQGKMALKNLKKTLTETSVQAQKSAILAKEIKLKKAKYPFSNFVKSLLMDTRIQANESAQDA